MELQSCIAEEIEYIPLEELSADPDQPRKYFDPDRLDELKKSIQENGILDPLWYRKDDQGNKIIVSGEYRYRAAMELKLSTVPTRLVLRDHAFIAIAENLTRNGLIPMEKARAIKSLITDTFNQADVAKKLGLAESSISEIIKPTDLPENIQQEALTSAFWSNNILLKLARKNDVPKNMLFLKK
jgi:ParB family chromosome partitioning protein